MEAVKSSYLLFLSLSWTLQEKPDYVEIFDRVSKLDKDSFALISTDELLAYNQVLFHCLIMDEYAKKGNFWWKDSSPHFTSMVYHQLLEKRISLIEDQRLCDLVNSILHKNFSEEYILSHREDLAETIKQSVSFKKPSISNSNLSD